MTEARHILAFSFHISAVFFFHLLPDSHLRYHRGSARARQTTHQIQVQRSLCEGAKGSGVGDHTCAGLSGHGRWSENLFVAIEGQRSHRCGVHRYQHLRSSNELN